MTFKQSTAVFDIREHGTQKYLLVFFDTKNDFKQDVNFATEGGGENSGFASFWFST